MKKDYDYIIGIDPDVDESGVGAIKMSDKGVYATKLRFPQLIESLVSNIEYAKDKGTKVVVVVEASWMNQKSNYHNHYGKAGDTIGKMVGRNQQTGKLIVECLKYKGIDVVEMKPLRKMWKGADRKISAEEICQICNLQGRHNQEERDALLLAWVFADLPL